MIAYNDANDTKFVYDYETNEKHSYWEDGNCSHMHREMMNETFFLDHSLYCINGSRISYYGSPTDPLPAGESALVFEETFSNYSSLYLYANGT